jgi:hypothetical protein
VHARVDPDFIPDPDRLGVAAPAARSPASMAWLEVWMPTRGTNSTSPPMSIPPPSSMTPSKLA